jgi:hypothetical protein
MERSVLGYLFDDIPGTLQRALREDAEFGCISRELTVNLIVLDGSVHSLRLVDGSIVTSEFAGPESEVSAICVSASRESWNRFVQAIPPRFYNSILAMERRVSDFSFVTGRMTYIRHIRAVDRLFAVVRGMEGQHDVHH